MGSISRRLLNQSTHSSVANSTVSASPRSAPMDDLGLVETVDRFGECVVVAVSDATNRRLHAGLRQALGVFDRDVLAAPVAYVHEPAAMDGPPVMQRLLQCVEHEAGMGRPADPPAHDTAGIGIDHKGDVNEAVQVAT